MHFPEPLLFKYAAKIVSKHKERLIKTYIYKRRYLMYIIIHAITIEMDGAKVNILLNYKSIKMVFFNLLQNSNDFISKCIFSVRINDTGAML